VTYRGIISNGTRSCHPRDPCKGSSGLAISLARKQGVHVQVRAVLQSNVPLVLIITRSRDYYRPTPRATSTYADADLRKFRHNRENGFTSSGASRRLIAALYITGFVYRHLHLVLPSSASKKVLAWLYVRREHVADCAPQKVYSSIVGRCSDSKLKATRTKTTTKSNRLDRHVELLM
jgi:hypothetical protein